MRGDEHRAPDEAQGGRCDEPDQGAEPHQGHVRQRGQAHPPAGLGGNSLSNTTCLTRVSSTSTNNSSNHGAS